MRASYITAAICKVLFSNWFYIIWNDFIILQLIDDLPMRDMETFKTDQTIATYDI